MIEKYYSPAHENSLTLHHAFKKIKNEIFVENGYYCVSLYVSNVESGWIRPNHFGELNSMKKLINQILTYCKYATTSLITFSFVSNSILVYVNCHNDLQNNLDKTAHIRVKIIIAIDIIKNNIVS